LLLFRQLKRLGCGNNTELLVIRANYPNFRRADGIIDVYGRFCYDCTSWVDSSDVARQAHAVSI
jgi:hypothetical protein